MIDNGNYAEVSFEEARQVLARRAGNGPETITIVRYASEDEVWRHFLAHDIDVVLNLPAASLGYLAQVPSVRLEALPEPSAVGLLFNVNRPPVSEQRIRRAIGIALDRVAIATQAANDKGKAYTDLPHDLDEARALVDAVTKEQGKVRFHLLVLGTQREFELAALVIQAELAAVGIEVVVDQVEFSPGSAKRIVGERDFEALLIYLGSDPFTLDRWTTTSPYNITGFSSAAYDKAVTEGDGEKAKQLLRDAVPFAPLFRETNSVAIDARLCGGSPQSEQDLSWLADLHQCAP
jgi:ABC-type transport system substrate-binding protein